MQILHINSNYIYTPLHQLLTQAQRRQGITSEIFAPVVQNAKPSIPLDDNVCAVGCFAKWDRLFFDLKQSKILRAAEQNVDAAAYDLIHAHTVFTDGNAAMKLARKYAKPYIVAVRNTDINTFFKRAFYLRGRGVKILRNAAAVIFLAETYKKQLFETYIPARFREEIIKKCHVIPNGIDDFWIQNAVTEKEENCRRIEQKKLELLLVGRVERNKNAQTAAKACEILRQRGWDVRLTLVGKAADEKLYEQLIQKPFVRHIPHSTKEQLLPIYQKSDIYVMPSFHESFGLVYAEAMSQGLPIIYTQGQGFDAQFPEGDVGFHVLPDSAEDIAEKILLITEQYAQMSARCSERSRKFDWNLIAARYAELYTELRETK